MTVKQLKEILDKFNDNLEVRIQCQDEGGVYDSTVEITDVLFEIGDDDENYVLIY